MGKDTITEEKAKQTPAGGVLVGKREGQTIIHDKGTEGGYFVGRLHKEGGIKGINKSTGQPIEVQGGEVIITAPAVADQTKREFEGEMLTNREILSKINEKGGGVSLENGGEILINGSAYNYGGMTMTDYEIMQKMNECGCNDEYEDGGEVEKALNDLEKAPSVNFWNEPEFQGESYFFDKEGEPNSFVSLQEDDISKTILAYDEDGQLVGVFRIRTSGDLKGAFKIVVSEDAMRKGWGKKLLDEAEKQNIDIVGNVKNNSFSSRGRDLLRSWLNEKTNTYKKGGEVDYVSYKDKYNLKFKYSKGTSHSLEEISKDTGVSMKGLQQIYNKGIGAYKTNPSSVRPNVKSKEQWAMARVYSAVMGGKASKVDSNELVMENGGLIAPNGKQTNLTAEQYKLVRTPEFKAWFGDWENDPKNASKVVDENGEPLVVYHGTNKVFNSFEKELKAHYFAVDIKYANFVTKEYKGVEKELARIIPAFLNIRKLQRVNFPIEKSSVSAYLNDHKFLKQVDGGIYGFDDVEESLFDKIQDIDTRVYVCFNPDQIKIADGTNTTFDSNTDDIRFDDGGSVKTPNQFWGNVAGGALMYCTTTKRFLILKRSQYVLEPNTWGIISGKMDEDETSVEEAVIREVKEETGFTIKDLYPSYVFKKGNFTFYNYIGFVDYEFMPKLNWENVDYRWVKLKDFPSNLHFGLKLLIENEDLDNVEKNINQLAFLDDADSFFDDGGKTTSKNKELLNEGTDGVIGGALTVPFSDAVAGFNLSNGTTSTNGSESIINSFEEGGSTKELVEFVEISNISMGVDDPSNNLVGTKYYSLEELLKDIYEEKIKIKKIYKSTFITFLINGEVNKTFTLSITTGRNSFRKLSVKNPNKKYFIEQKKYLLNRYNFQEWIDFDNSKKQNPKPKPQPEPKKEITIDLSFKYIQINGDIELAKRVVERAEKLGWTDNKGTKRKLEDNDFIESIWFDFDGYVGLNSTIRKDEITELELFGEDTQPQPKKEEEKKVEKIDFEATKKYLNQRIATLTKELNFKKPRLSNEEIGFFQRDINTLIQKLRNVNERYLELLPLKNRLENAYSLKWGDINAVYEPSKELLAPNGLPTKLTEEEWINVRNDSFSSFFGDWQLANEIGDFSGVSKVIDPITKEPMPVYHGTNVLFTEWKTYKSNNAHYFAKERDFSTWFAEQWSKGRGDISAVDSNLLKQLNPNKGEYVYRCFLDIKNPIDFSRFGVEKRPVSDFLMFLQINYNIGDFDFWTNFRLFNNLAQDTLVYSWMIIRNWQSFTEYVKLATTYDGYIFYEYHPDKVGTGLEGASLSFCTFDSSQIKFTNSSEFNSLITDSRFNFGGKL